MVILNTINMGSALDIQIVKDCLKKPIGPAVGAFCQFVVMPLVGIFNYYIGNAQNDNNFDLCSLPMGLAMLCSTTLYFALACLYWDVHQVEMDQTSGASCLGQI